MKKDALKFWLINEQKAVAEQVQLRILSEFLKGSLKDAFILITPTARLAITPFTRADMCF